MRWFTSDQHFGHERIIELCNRPFKSVQEMNEEIIQRWNLRVSEGDVVYVLGDFALGQIAETLPLAGRLNGRKILIPGNHDRCWAGERRAPRREQWREKYLAAGFDVVWPHARAYTIVVGEPKHEMPVWLSHFPYDPDPYGRPELDAFRPNDHGRWLLHGHIHNLRTISGRQINVGVDRWDFAPVSEAEILRIITPWVR